jgi:F-type H+-transporting ATPase subunit delta
MLKGAIARRYAQAIFEIGRKQNTLDRTLDDVQEIARLFAHRTLAYLLREPKIPVQRKETAIRQTVASKVLPTSLNLALLVVQRELVDLMQNIARELEQLVLDYKNQAMAEVTTATQMDEAQLTLVKQALERRTGKTILMQTNIEPAILGGVIARVGDQVIDGSVKHRLTVLQQRLLTGVASSSADLLPATEPMEQPAGVVSNGRDTTAAETVLTGQDPEADNVKPKQRAKPRRKQKK